MRDSYLTQAVWLMSLRVVVITFLMVITVLIECRSLPSGALSTLFPLYMFIASVYLLSAGYGLLLKMLRRYRATIYAQLTLDPLLVTALIYLTGGTKSPSTFLYLLVIIVASQLLHRTGGLLIATLSSALYGGLLVLQYLGYISPINPRQGLSGMADGQIFYNGTVHILSFYLIAFLSSYWSEQSRRNNVELARSKRNIRDLETFNLNVIQSIDNGLITLDPNGFITSFNRAAETITALPGTAVKGQLLARIFPELEVPSEAKHIVPDFYFKNKSGKDLCLSFSFSPLINADFQAVGQLVLFQDITEIKAIEAQMDRNRILASIGELAATMAHEIRNPLASLTGCVQMFAAGMDKQDLTNIILRDGEKLDRLLSDFLAYAKPEDAKPQRMEVCQIILETIENRAKQPRSANIRILTDLRDSLYLHVDRKHFSKIMENLLFNFHDFASGAESIDLKGELLNRREADRLGPEKIPLVHIEIRYAGRNITSFHPEVNQSATLQVGSLGLTLVCRLIEFYNGQIRFEDQSGQAVVCHLYFPYYEEA